MAAGMAGNRLCGPGARSAEEAFNSLDPGFKRKGAGPDSIFKVGLLFQCTGSQVRSCLSLSVPICRMGLPGTAPFTESLEDALRWSVLRASLGQGLARDGGSVRCSTLSEHQHD